MRRPWRSIGGHLPQSCGRGDSEYLTAFKKFVDFAVSENATFVTTMDLAKMAKRNRPTSGISSIDLGLNSSNLFTDRATA